MIDFFKSCNGSAAIGVVFDFAEETETFHIGCADSIKAYAYSGMLDVVPVGIMKHKSKLGYLIKNINQLMKVKHELNDLIDVTEKLCDLDSFCDGTCGAVLEELSSMYEISDYCNVMKNFIIYTLYCSFVRQRNEFNKKVGLTVKGNHDRAEKYIAAFKSEADSIFEPFLFARKKDKFVIDRKLLAREMISERSTYIIRSDETVITMSVAHNSYIALLGMYEDILFSANWMIDNCEICDQLIVAKRENYAPVCNRTTCKREHSSRMNMESRERAMKNPANEYYIRWDGKCLNYRKKLKGMPEQLALYDAAHEKYRTILQKKKKGLTARSSVERIEHYEMLCDDSALELQDYSKVLKKGVSTELS